MKAGDLVRYNTRGEFVYAGRADFQIKVCGQRVEPAEIENIVMNWSSDEVELICDLNDNFLNYDQIDCIHSNFAYQIHLHVQKAALVLEYGSVTYDTLQLIFHQATILNKLSVLNFKPQKQHSSPVIAFNHLVILDLQPAHVDYVE
ncbi:unnamed protein product [Rotaria sordida]|uniref:Uncharacterized protein n=1 Tax=Rotaria sordida TaxID=392033 RepID=A0A814MDN4_9BILA|nr:unnamed protein product [Rotaria sordida]